MSIVDIVSNGTAISKTTERMNKITFSTGSGASLVKIKDYTPNISYPSSAGGARMVYYSQALYRFGGYNLAFSNEFWKFDLNPASGTYQTWIQITATGGPSTRYEHFMFEYNGLIYVGYGFAGSGSFMNDLFSYNPSTNTWASVTQNGSIPTARQSDAYDKNGTDFYIFGGLTNGQTRLADCQKLVLTTMTWSQVSNNAYTARTNFAAASVGQYVYFYGGDTNSGADGTLYRLNTVGGAISSVSPTGTAPGALYSYRMITIGTNIYLYGGRNGSNFNTMWVLNALTPAALSWTTSYTNLLSYARSSHGMATDGTVIYIDDGNIGDVGAAYSETWSVTTAGVATQLPTKQIYVNATSFTYGGVTFTAVNIGGTTRVSMLVNPTVVGTGAILSLKSLNVNP